MSISVDIRVTVDSEWIDTMVDMAGYGINYWAESAHWDGKVYTIRPQSEFVGNQMTWRDTGTPVPMGEEYTLTPQLIAMACAEAAKGEKCARYIAEYAMEALRDSENGACAIDSELADVVIQLAAFGEIIFG